MIFARLKHFFIGLSVMGFGFGFGAMVPATVASAADCNARLLTLPAWHTGLPKDANCALKPPSNSGTEGQGISRFVWRIVLNIVEIALQIVAYASAGFVIYGGFKYLMSTGLPDRTAAARKTIMHALVGLIVSFLSVVIVNIVASRIQP